MSRSKHRTVIVLVSRDVGPPPPFLSLAQRHFEKDPPPHASGDAVEATVTLPLDTIRMIRPNDPIITELLEQIDEIVVTYKRRAS